MKILMVGNSFMSENNLPGVIGDITGGNVDSILGADAYLRNFITSGNSLCTRLDSALKNTKYDYVVLQDYSNNPLINSTDFYASVNSLNKKISENGATTVLMQTWAYRPGDVFYKTSGYSYNSMAAGLYNAYHNAAVTNSIPAAYVGQAFYKYSNINALYTSEGQHPSTTGTKIAAQVITDTIFIDYINK